MTLSRRRLLQAAAAATISSAWPSRTRATPSPNDGFGILAIGVRGAGGGGARRAAAYGRIVAVCDVDSEVANRFVNGLEDTQSARPVIFSDYRKALECPGVQIVTIGTPDHWHARILVDAVRAGKDVYVEKPMTLTVREGQIACQVVKETGRIVQVGTQNRSNYDGVFVKMAALARNGRLGEKLTATVKLPSGYGKAETVYPTTTPPETLNWDMWLGPVPTVAYCPSRCHGSWRNWVETGSGPITDWGAHHVDIAQWALGAEHSGPIEITCSGVWPQGREATLAMLLGQKPVGSLPNGYSTIREYGARLRFANGNVIKIESVPRTRQNDGRPAIGVEVAGEKGAIWATRMGEYHELSGSPMDEINDDASQSQWLTDEAVRLYKGQMPTWGKAGTQDVSVPHEHMHNFVACVRDRSEPVSDVWTHHRANTSCILAWIAALVGRKIAWDPEKQEVIGDEQANALLTRTHREPYSLHT